MKKYFIINILRISMSSIKGDENNPERTIEELRLEI